MRTTSICRVLLVPVTVVTVALTVAGCTASPSAGVSGSPRAGDAASVGDTATSPASASPAPSASSPTPAIAAPVAATPTAAVESPDDPLTPLTAWATCYSAATTSSVIDPADWDPTPYRADAVTVDAGVYAVEIGFAPARGDGFGAVMGCTATGTLGAPVITLSGPSGLG